MRRLIPAIFLGTILSLCPALASAGSTALSGPGVDRLDVPHDPDENGLSFFISEPNKIYEPWVIVVRNDSDRTIYGIEATLEIEIDGDWYIPNLQAETSFVPSVLEPGDMAFATAGSMGGGDDWDNARVTVNQIADSPSDTVVDLEVSDVEFSRSGNSGRVTNDTDYSVSHVTVFVGCPTLDGHFTEAFVNVLDIRKLDSGDAESYHFTKANGTCGSITGYIIAAMGRIR